MKKPCSSIDELLLTDADISFGAYLAFIHMLNVPMIAPPRVPGGTIAAAAGLLA